MNYIKSVIPFAFSPENRETRHAKELEVNIILGEFNMKVSEPPVCAGIAIKLNPEQLPKEYRVHFYHESLTLELEGKKNKEKYIDFPSELDKGDLVFDLSSIDPQTDELTLCCWKSENMGKHEEFIILLK